MRVNNALYNTLLNLIKSSSTDSQGSNNDKEINNPININISNDILSLLNKFNDKNKKEIITNWYKNNLPLTREHLQKLLSIIKNSSDKSSARTKIKAFALLLKNSIEPTPKLVGAAASNLNHKKTISKLINQITESENIGRKIKQILQQLQINTSTESEQITKELTNYNTALMKGLEILSPEKNDKSQKLFQQLLGQQIINNSNNNLLSSLELPLYFPQYKRLLSGFLKIYKEPYKNQTDKNNNNKNRTYKIIFSIDLPDKGTIQAEIYYNKKYIKSIFGCESKEIRKLIKSNFDMLKEKLKLTGSIVEEVEVNLLTDKDNIAKNNKNTDLEEAQLQNENILENYKHINFKI
ncbi:MAG: flagellar hook-length control protein FliK [Halothermotrichaceae bacterium]